jgi:hypothetical protein
VINIKLQGRFYHRRSHGGGAESKTKPVTTGSQAAAGARRGKEIKALFVREL